jgi:hypothetical protein
MKILSNHPLEHDIKVFFASINSGVDMWTLDAKSIKQQVYHTLRHNCLITAQHSSSIFPVVRWFGAGIVFEPCILLIAYSLDENGLDYVLFVEVDGYLVPVHQAQSRMAPDEFIELQHRRLGSESRRSTRPS